MESNVQPLLRQLFDIYGYVVDVGGVSFGEIGPLLNAIGDGLDYATLSNGLEVLVRTNLLRKDEGGYSPLKDITGLSEFSEDMTTGLQLDDSKLIASTFDSEGIKSISPAGDVEYWRAYVPSRQRYLLPYLEGLSLIMFTDGGRVISIGHESVIARYIVGAIRKSSKRRKSLQTLLDELEAKRKLGAMAEDIAMAFERRRLTGIGLERDPELISNDYVNAGCDIMSFMKAESTEFDRCIEVKAMGPSDGFYLSRNELEKAQEQERSYFIYLVDVTRSTPEKPVVEMIQDPAKVLFEDDTNWVGTVENYRFSRIGADDGTIQETPSDTSEERLKEGLIIADRFTPEKRSELMSRIRGKNTRPELLVYHLLRTNKIYFRKHYRSREGIVLDLALPRKKRAVFIDGDFWHGRTVEAVAQKRGESDFWTKKLRRNIERDAYQRALLKEHGWAVLTIWESDLMRKTTQAESLDRVTSFLTT